MFFKSKSSKPTLPKSVPIKSFHDEFPTLNHLLKRFKLSDEMIWPAPDEIEVALQDYCEPSSDNLEKALTLYQREYEMRTGTTFRQALYRIYAIMCGFPKFKDAFLAPQDLIQRIGMPVGSLWPSPEIIRGCIEEKSLVNLHTLQEALLLYGKVHKMEISMSFPGVIIRMHEILSRD